MTVYYKQKARIPKFFKTSMVLQIDVKSCFLLSQLSIPVLDPSHPFFYQIRLKSFRQNPVLFEEEAGRGFKQDSSSVSLNFIVPFTFS